MYSFTLDDLKVTLRDLSGILQVLSIVMLVPVAATVFYTSAQSKTELFHEMLAFLLPSLVFYMLYTLSKKAGKTKTETRTSHALTTVVVAWMIIAIVGMLPFLVRGTLGPVDSFFESMSGWATTGMTMIEYPENIDKDILLYRSLTHLVGGVGIIALGLVVFLNTGKAAAEYYGSEVGVQRIKPGIRGTVVETWKIYMLYAFAGTILYFIAGMSFFDALNHSWAAIATGGFSTHSQSIGHFDSVVIEVITILLMLAGAVSFLLHYRLFTGDVKSLLSNVESKFMFFLILTSTLVVWASVFNSAPDFNSASPAISLRKSAFQTVSAITCTGFGTSDTGQWPELAQTVLIMLMYSGGFYGSTAGGIKLLRLAVIVKSIHYVFKRMMLPKNAVVAFKLGEKNIDFADLLYVLGFSMIYLIISLVGAILLMSLGFTGMEGVELSFSAMGNVGIVFVTGARWFEMVSSGKIVLALLMWIGRLEVFPILLLLRPLVRRKNKMRG
ncbi:MAG TPA: TrkH family potassium uptake protein [Candidatus Altiarchaeales archaeon]|nr:TrkH family potassium uptake protein [Candidatus Altiarchaeales archaeon]